MDERDLMDGVLWQAFCNTYPYTVLVRSYAFGQYRIQLTDATLPAPYSPQGHGAILREFCTYDQKKAEVMTDALGLASDPVQFANTLETLTNCDCPGSGRIRLDDEPEDHVEGYKR